MASWSPHAAAGGAPVDVPAVAADAAAAARPAAITVRLRSDMSLTSRHGLVVPAGARLRLTAQLAQPATRPVTLQRLDGRVRVRQTTTRADGRVTLGWRASGSGRQRYRVVAPPADGQAAARSAVLRVTVRAERAGPRTDPAPTEEPAPTAVAAPSPSGSAEDWTLLDTGRPGAAFRWDPCTPVRYRVSLGGATPGFAGQVRDTVAQIGAATGLTFVDVGTTTFAGSAPGAPWPADADLVVAVTDEAAAPQLAGPPVGYASILQARGTATDVRISRALVVLEDAFLTRVGQLPGGAGTTTELLLHELGHAVGLGHSATDSQVMFPTLAAVPRSSYQVGDLAGLTRVGAKAGCLATQHRP